MGLRASEQGFSACGDHILQVLLDLKDARLGGLSASVSLGIRQHRWTWHLRGGRRHLLTTDPFPDLVCCELGEGGVYEAHGWPLTSGSVWLGSIPPLLLVDTGFISRPLAF